MCVLVCIYKYNILNQFSAAPREMCLGLTTRHWITYQGAQDQGVITLLSSINCPQLSITQRDFSINGKMLKAVQLIRTIHLGLLCRRFFENLGRLNEFKKFAPWVFEMPELVISNFWF